MEEIKQFWYFTFCLGDEEKKDKYVKFYGTYSEARNKMFCKFGEHWAFQYDAKEMMKNVKQFGLTLYEE